MLTGSRRCVEQDWKMIYGQEMNNVLGRIEGIDNPVITDPKTIAIAAGQMIMRKATETKTHFINFGFDPGREHFLEAGRTLHRIGNKKFAARR